MPVGDFDLPQLWQEPLFAVNLDGHVDEGEQIGRLMLLEVVEAQVFHAERVRGEAFDGAAGDRGN